MTTLGYTALLIGALVVGAVGGYFLRRQDGGHHEGKDSGPTVAELLRRLVHSSDSGIMVLNKFGDVVLHNPRADKLGFLRDSLAEPRARAAAQQAVKTGEAVTVDLSPLNRTLRGLGPAAVLGEARPLGDGFAVIDAGDESDAVRLEATRRDFVANVSHELKTPVGALALLAEAVIDASDDADEVRRFSTKILHESTRLGTLVSELIALSRLQGAERLPEMTVIEVDDVLEDALGRCRIAAESAGIEIAVDEASGLKFEGDRTLMATALANLINNAIAYSPPGSPVSVSRREVGEHVEIAVTDRGIGIAPEHQKRVFERFFRVDPARSRATGGTGLGLAIVKHVAANHGGEVKLWSRPSTGSTFTVRVPTHGGASGEGQQDAAETERDTSTQGVSDSADGVRAVETGGVR